MRTRRGWLVVGAAAALVVVLVVVFGRFLPAGDRDDAATAAVNAIWGDDPPAGAYGECRHAPNVGFVVLRARYSCVVRRCDEESARLDVIHNLLGGWSYRITRGGIPYVSRSGRTSPSSSAATELNPGNC